MLDTGTLIEVLIIIVKAWILTGIIFSLPMPLTWLERKVAGHIHVRLGPMRVGPHGIFQPLADTLKLILKEDIVPDRADRFLFKLAPLIAMIPAFLVFVEMVRAQAGGMHHWNILYLPIGPVWFVIFLIAALAEMNRIPFDLPEDEGTLASGFHTEYSGMRFSYFMLAEPVAIVSVSVLIVIVFVRARLTPR